MKLARIEYRGEVCEAEVTCAGYLISSPAGLVGTTVSEDEISLLPPVAPGKILGVGWNFREHIKEMVTRAGRIPNPSNELVPHPVLFFKPPTCLIGHRDAIEYPFDATRVEYEGELAVAISRRIRRVTPAEAAKAVWGWTCANDVTERDQQAEDKQWWRAKGYDTFGAIGPFLETEAPSAEAYIRTRVNGELRQEAQVQDMIRDPFEIISLVSQAMTLERGDLIMLGTSSGVGELHPGDEVEVDIDGVGRLRNQVRMEER
jgi:2-keto-4-pentenoate hydratase/2-oxohepta-3-ene-1,7-dioic acid hydratase in catechol pathway